LINHFSTFSCFSAAPAVPGAAYCVITTLSISSSVERFYQYIVPMALLGLTTAYFPYTLAFTVSPGLTRSTCPTFGG